MAPTLRRSLVTAGLTFVGVCVAFLLGDGHGILPWLLVFVVGLAIGFRSGGPWLAGVVGVIGAQVVVEIIQLRFWMGSVRTIASLAGDGLLVAIVVFTPAYLFGAAARRGPGPPAEPERVDPAVPGSPSGGLLSSGQMVFIGCGILTVFGLLMAYIVWQWTRLGGY
jgi:hypothetical protein